MSGYTSNLCLTIISSIYRPSLEECLCWKESFEKILSSKCKEMLIFGLLFWQPSKQMFYVCSYYAI